MTSLKNRPPWSTMTVPAFKQGKKWDRSDETEPEPSEWFPWTATRPSVLTQALEHGRWGPHTWALGDCCTLGRCPSTHTPHTTPHAHTLGQHIGYEEGHPPTQGPHQQSMSRETGAGRWEEVGVDARGHCDAWAGRSQHSYNNNELSASRSQQQQHKISAAVVRI